MVLATAVEKVWALWQLDVQTTFTYVDVEEKVCGLRWSWGTWLRLR